MLKLLPTRPVGSGLSWLLCPVILWALLRFQATTCSRLTFHCFLQLRNQPFIQSPHLHFYLHTLISASITIENHVWQSWKHASWISDCRKHNWLTAPAAALWSPLLFPPKLRCPPAASSQWLSAVETLQLACCSETWAWADRELRLWARPLIFAGTLTTAHSPRLDVSSSTFHPSLSLRG